MTVTNNKPQQISWLTHDSFIDCDIEIIKDLAQYYTINWTVVLHRNKGRFKESDFAHLQGVPNLKISFAYSEYRERDPKNISFYFKLIKNLKKQKPDLFYINHVATPYFALAAYTLLNKRKTIYTAHQGAVHSGFSFQALFIMSYKLVYSSFKNINLFSQTQADIFKSHHPQHQIFVIPLTLKDFGTSQKTQRQDKVVFFNFGTIGRRKGIDLLIDAACNVYESGVKNFHVVIAGNCKEWDYYESRIKYPELFTCDIRALDNAEIPDLFTENHYLVLPYRIVTQSGPLKIAFQYNIPVIASDNGSFKEEIKHGVNGYLFTNDDVKSLEEVLRNAVLTHEAKYNSLRTELKAYVDEVYTQQNIINRYRKMFDSVAGK